MHSSLWPFVLLDLSRCCRAMLRGFKGSAACLLYNKLSPCLLNTKDFFFCLTCIHSKCEYCLKGPTAVHLLVIYKFNLFLLWMFFFFCAFPFDKSSSPKSLNVNVCVGSAVQNVHQSIITPSGTSFPTSAQLFTVRRASAECGRSYLEPGCPAA